MVGLGDFVLSFGIVVDIGLGDSDVVAKNYISTQLNNATVNTLNLQFLGLKFFLILQPQISEESELGGRKLKGF